MLVAEVATLKMGSPEDFSNFVNAVIDARSFDKISSYIDYAKGQDDCEIICGGNYDNSKGYFVEPTVIVTSNPQFRTMVEEIFGPVLAIIPFDSEEEAVEIANDTPYGLAAYVQTGSAERAARLSRSLRAGAVHINGGAYEYGSPFGGYKASGNGREGGEMGLEDFLETKMVHGLA